MAQLLLAAGADLAATARSWSHDVDAIYFAAGVKDLAVFNLLLDRGADATGALSTAVWNGAYELAEAALAHGAQPDRATANGKPLLNDLIRWGQFRQAYWLLERGASPNLPDGSGWTAVHQAASRGNENALRAVLKAGGDATRRDQSGRSPRDLATKSKLAELLAK
jgi:ankyrin repeat protein